MSRPEVNSASAIKMGRRVPRPPARNVANPERSTSATAWTPLTAQNKNCCRYESFQKLHNREASLARCLHCAYTVLAANAASQFAQEQMSPSQKVFSGL